MRLGFRSRKRRYPQAEEQYYKIKWATYCRSTSFESSVYL